MARGSGDAASATGSKVTERGFTLSRQRNLNAPKSCKLVYFSSFWTSYASPVYTPDLCLLNGMPNAK